MVIKGGPPPNLGLYDKLFATRLFTRRSKAAICLSHNDKEVKALLCTKDCYYWTCLKADWKASITSPIEVNKVVSLLKHCKGGPQGI